MNISRFFSVKPVGFFATIEKPFRRDLKRVITQINYIFK